MQGSVVPPWCVAVQPVMASSRRRELQTAVQELRGSPWQGRGLPTVRPALGLPAAGRTISVLARVTSASALTGGRDHGLRQPAGHRGAGGACDTPSVFCEIGDGGFVPTQDTARNSEGEGGITS